MKKTLKILLWLSPLFFMIVIFGLFYCSYIPIKGDSLEERGQFGDSFGVLNSLFTGLGFGGLVITLMLQQKQIIQQEQEITSQRKAESVRHYEDTLFKLLELYLKTLSEISNSHDSTQGRNILYNSNRRALNAIRKEGAQLIPHDIQERHLKNKLTENDKLHLDYLYFRNFKILTVEIDRQGRLVETFKILLRHLINNVPTHLQNELYTEIIASQITVVELTYFYLISLTFNNEDELRKLMLESGMIKRAAHIKRMKIHDFMYENFWGVNIRSFKKPILLPIGESRINKATRHFREKNNINANVKLKSYTSPRLNPTQKNAMK